MKCIRPASIYRRLASIYFTLAPIYPRSASIYLLSILLSSAILTPAFGQQSPVFRDPSQPVAARVNDLLARLTPEEKVSLLGYRSRAVERLSIPAYNWWNEALHGVARAGEATVFPQAIGIAATFNNDLLRQESGYISTEARAKYNLSTAAGRSEQYMGLTFWSPNINIFRDPRWGRGQETYGEDPFLTAAMGAAFVKGLQGDDAGARQNGGPQTCAGFSR